MDKLKFSGTRMNEVMSVQEIYFIHYCEFINAFESPSETTGFWRMLYVDCGQIEVRAEGESFVLQQGEAYFSKPGDEFGYRLESSFAGVFLIGFSTQSADVLYFNRLRTFFTDYEKRLVTLILDERLTVFAGALDILDQPQLVRNDDAPYGGEQVIRMLFECLLVNVVRHTKEEVRERKPAADGKIASEQYIVDSVLNILTRSLYKKLTLDDICRQVAFSKSYIEKLFHNTTGLGIIKYFNKLKTEEAKRLIIAGGHSFTAIADMLNFGSIQYFSRTFKSFTGMSPSEYAKSAKGRTLKVVTK